MLIFLAAGGFVAGAVLSVRHGHRVQQAESSSKHGMLRKGVKDSRRALVAAHTIVRAQLCRAFLLTSRHALCGALTCFSLAGPALIHFACLQISACPAASTRLQCPPDRISVNVYAGVTPLCQRRSHMQPWPIMFPSWPQPPGCALRRCAAAAITNPCVCTT